MFLSWTEKNDFLINSDCDMNYASRGQFSVVIPKKHVLWTHDIKDCHSLGSLRFFNLSDCLCVPLQFTCWSVSAECSNYYLKLLHVVPLSKLYSKRSFVPAPSFHLEECLASKRKRRGNQLRRMIRRSQQHRQKHPSSRL